MSRFNKKKIIQLLEKMTGPEKKGAMMTNNQKMTEPRSLNVQMRSKKWTEKT